MMKKTLIVLMYSILSAFLLSSCRNDRLDDTAADIKDDMKAAEGVSNNLPAIGLTYHSFASDDDVIILNSDTTEISVSKELADRLGVESFEGRVMGIWQKINYLPFIRRAVSERLEDDRYVLHVEKADVAEALAGISAKVETNMFLDRSANGSLKSSEATISNVEQYVERYKDENSVIHPAAVLLTDPYGYDKEVHYADEKPTCASQRKATDGYLYYTPESMLGVGGALGSSGQLLSVYTELEKKIYIPIASDSLTVWITCPLMFQLNYTFTFDTGWKHVWAFIYRPCVEKFEAGVDGSIDFKPQLTFGYQTKWMLPKDKRVVNIANFSGYTFVFMIGPIPVTISIKPTLDLVFFAQVSGKLYTRIEYEYKSEFKSGIVYTQDSGWDTYSSSDTKKNKVSFYPARFDFKAIASAGLMLGAEVSVYETVGPGVSIGPNLLFNSKLSIKPDEKKVSFKGDMDFGLYCLVFAKLKLLGYSIADWNTYAKIGPSKSLWHYDSDERPDGNADGDIEYLY